MATCDVCGREVGMPYQCRFCGGTFCADHRLPESHDCPGLEEWNDPDGVFDSGFDDTTGTDRSSSSSVTDAIPVDTGPGGLFAYFKDNVTYLFLAAMWVVFLLEAIVLFVLGDLALFRALFTLSSENVTYVWTWVTSVFAHDPGGFFHIFFNSIVLYFFGPVVERRIGSKKFAVLFLISGVVAGLAQVLAAIAVGGSTSVLGASGAIAALLGVLTILNPNLRIYLYFVIPMPLWVATALFAAYSILVSTAGGIGFGGVAQLAHLAGLGIGLLYGLILKRQGARAPQQLRFGGGGGGGAGGRRRGPGRF
ncbi:rhomboid family intramembrane serine protease [Halanaeroarchaeum sulfurireducens]|uniref:Rhomboid family protein n=1 Tax=Halanaeroarchaeum sulfurireducens TaxID=1604004 RepID=A0A0F7P7N2_9EURY|nr:rhomboid family intramembrane serine protease [Halanaeroarchaeum sulfurireducens]AKH97156.1 rhomboid family protein [Halanaeroarchaeum sulfurireducens]ALG81557.1 rhomboid family protein [Halanaeroarchaeum sulfurireducens]